MSARKVYVVMGEVGEYSDWSTWVVRAFEAREEAEAFAVLARKHLEDLQRASAAMDVDWYEARESDAATLMDPGARFYGGELPEYTVVETELGRWPA